MEKTTKNNSFHDDRSQASSNVGNQQEGTDQEYEEDEEWDLYTEMGVSSEGYPEEDFCQPLPSDVNSTDVPMHKYPFKLKQSESGNILTVHHTIKFVERHLRIRIAVCCFNELSNKLVVIDRRGNIYVFDFVSKRYWRLSFGVPQATLLQASPLQRNEYIVGDEHGHILVLDVEKSVVGRRNKIGNAAIDQISWGNRLQSRSAPNTVMRFGPEAVLLNLRTMKVTHQLEFDQSRYTLKFAGYMPNSDQFFTCFTNDSIHIWSTHTLQTVHIAQPIRARDRKLRLLRNDKSIPEIFLRGADDEDGQLEDELAFECDEEHFADGKLLTYCFSPNGNKLCLSTIDGFLMLLSTASLEVNKIFRLRDFTLKQMVMLPQPKERILFATTTRGMAIVLDLEHTNYKLIVQRSNAVNVSVSRDGKLLSVLSKCGEVNVWSTCRLYNALQAQTHCISQVRAALKLPKLPGVVNGTVNRELRQLLKRERLEAMLAEFGCYPEKYRFVIWSTLLELPSNCVQFQALLKLGQPAVVRQRARALKMSSDAQRRGIIKVWSCLAHWCKVFGYTDFMPDLIFPFVKQMPKNSLVVFELLVTLLLNHLQLCFEFHPMPPENYLAMCENVLQQQDEQLSKFYLAMDVKSKDYAWSMLTNGFAEVLNEQQWLMLWDNIVTEPPYFIVFVIVAYNLLQREVILRLPQKSDVLWFFHEQNPIDVAKWVVRARKLMSKCPANVHPQRFLPHFAPIPRGVYPKFLNYPSEWIEQQEEQTAELIKQNQEIDARIRNLELEELKMKDRLETGLKQEEHTRRLKEMEKLYQDTIQREEERIACHRKMLLAYQLEVRQRKSEVLSQLKESEQRRKILEMEKDIDVLMHGIERARRRQNQEMLFAEDEIRNQDMELFEKRYLMDPLDAPLAQKYYDNIQKMCQQRDELKHDLRQMSLAQLQRPTTSPTTAGEIRMTEIERSIQEIQREFRDLISSDSSSK